MVFFLTDGHPTVGVTDTLEILDNIRTSVATNIIRTTGLDEYEYE